DERSGERPDDRDAEEAEEPADDPADRTGHVRRIALAQDRLDAPVHRRAERPQRQRLLDDGDQQRGNQDKDEGSAEELDEEPPIDRAADAGEMPADAPDQRAAEEGSEEALHGPRNPATRGAAQRPFHAPCVGISRRRSTTP